ncbi:MAG: molybdate ABC transporter substrate-binding protein, partial [Oscillibacter sp.]|nr:molybdate ABC transporter substrate-binding protein [Oscillibacter sp.]
EAGEIFKEYGFTPYKAAEENETESETDTEETPETATEEVTE